MRVTPIINDFTAGCLSPKLNAREDLELFKKGLLDSYNVIVMKYGGVTAMPGTYYIAEAKDSADDLLILPFRYSNEQAYILEFGDEYMRVYMNGGQVMDSGVPYEISSPYSHSELSEIQIAQSADTIYLSHPDHYPQKLVRSGHISWAISDAPFVWGPFLDENTLEDSVATITPSAVTGSGVVFKPTDDLFESGHVGALWQLNGSKRYSDDFSSVSEGTSVLAVAGETMAYSLLDVWNGTMTLQKSFDDVTWYDYGAFTSNTSGEIIPTEDTYLRWAMTARTSGTCTASLAIPDSPGYMKITSVVSAAAEMASGSTLTFTSGAIVDSASGFITEGFIAGDMTLAGATTLANDGVFTCTSVTADVLLFAAGSFTAEAGVAGLSINQTLPDNAVGTVIEELPSLSPTTQWSEGAWSDVQGYPRAITFYQQRLILAGTVGRPQTIMATKAGDMENFKRGVLADSAWVYMIASHEVDDILWLTSDTALNIGTVGGEWRATGQSGGAISAIEAPDITNITHYGSEAITPIPVGKSIIFVQEGARVLRGQKYYLENDDWDSKEVSGISEHLFTSGVAGMVFQKKPITILWVWDSDGNLVACTHTSDGNMSAVRCGVKGTVKSMAVIPGDDGEDEVWFVVERTIDGSIVKYIEQMQPIRFDDRADCFYVNAGITFTGTATDTISGLDHLEGEEVSINKNGAAHPVRTVTSGSITLERAVKATDKVHIGLYETKYLKPQQISQGSERGTIQGKDKAIFSLTVRFLETIGAQVGKDLDHLTDEFSFRGSTPMGEAPLLFTGDKQKVFPGGAKKEATFILAQKRPQPFTVLGIMPTVSTSDL